MFLIVVQDFPLFSDYKFYNSKSMIEYFENDILKRNAFINV